MTDQYTPIINHFSALITVGNLSNDSVRIQEALNVFVSLLNLHVVKTVVHRFNPIGLTLVYILSESHLAIHTWPEHKLLHLDLVTCSGLEKDVMEKAVYESFSAFGIKKLSLAESEI